MYKVKVEKGEYRGKPMKGEFAMVKGWTAGQQGGFVTVEVENPTDGFPAVRRIKCKEADVKIFDNKGQEVDPSVMVIAGHGEDLRVETNYERQVVEAETDEETLARIARTFTVMKRIVDGCAQGNIRSLIVSGPPGVGKSHDIQEELDKAYMTKKMANTEPYFKFVSGVVSAIHLYQELYKYRNKDRVLVFDDCDSVLFDEDSLSILKAVSNSGDKRHVTWGKESRVLKESEVPNAFNFEAALIFVTNVDFEAMINGRARIAPALASMMSRSHYMDLELTTPREQILRIQQVLAEGMLADYNFNKKVEADLMSWLREHAEFLREISLRQVKHIADFVKTDPKDWRMLAENTLMSKEGKYKRLYEQKQKLNKMLKA